MISVASVAASAHGSWANGEVLEWGYSALTPAPCLEMFYNYATDCPERSVPRRPPAGLFAAPSALTSTG
jgi:hypothetical protein